MKSALFAAVAALLLSDPAEAATVHYKGNLYDGTVDSSYFYDNPTAVGATRTLRFYDDYCVWKAVQLQFRGETLQSCYLRATNAGSPVETGSFFSFSVDGFKGGPLKRTWFFTVTFAPTSYIDPLAGSDDYFKLFGTIFYDISWSSDFSGNNTDNFLAFEGSVIPPSPVPLPASGALAAFGLAALTALRRRRRRV